MRAEVWSDYLCPWCYVGRDRSALLRELGLEVDVLPYELHPEIPPAGRTVRPEGRLAPTFDRIEAECQATGVPFRRPTRMPNTRRALETAEVVRTRWPRAFAALDDALFRAHFVEGRPLDDPAVIDEHVAAAGAPVDDVRALVEASAGTALVDASMARARETGVTATPTWWVDERLLIPGALPRETIARWVKRLVERSSG